METEKALRKRMIDIALGKSPRDSTRNQIYGRTYLLPAKVTNVELKKLPSLNNALKLLNIPVKSNYFSLCLKV